MISEILEMKISIKGLNILVTKHRSERVSSSRDSMSQVSSSLFGKLFSAVSTVYVPRMFLAVEQDQSLQLRTTYGTSNVEVYGMADVDSSNSHS